MNKHIGVILEAVKINEITTDELKKLIKKV